MSVDRTELLFEGFLQKRKDTLKIRWVTYWFRLQNTTLFFYTKKNCSASHLRGYYYIYTVQSVREFQKTDKKRFMFEIIMTNGKRKVLAAETAALRKEWVGHLWQAMHLSTSGVSDSKGTDLEETEPRDRLNTCTPTVSHGDSVMELLPARPLSAPAASDLIHPEARSIPFPTCTEESAYQNTQPVSNYQNLSVDSLNDPQLSSALTTAENGQEGHYDVLPLRNSMIPALTTAENGQEGHYDFLPLRNRVCEPNLSPEKGEGVYDFPVSYRASTGHRETTESIYDVPSSLLRQTCDHTMDEQLEEEIYWTT